MNLAQRLIMIVTLVVLAVVSTEFEVYYSILNGYTVAGVIEDIVTFIISVFMPVLFAGSALFIIAGLKRGGN